MAQWYKIIRKDNTVQYAKKINEGYLLWGSGRVFISFECKSMTPIEGNPPKNLVEGFAYFENEINSFKCVVDTNDLWNGWFKPYIEKTEIERDIVNKKESSFKFEGEILIINDAYEKPIRIQPEILEDKLVYNLGNLGWTWEFSKSK